MVIQPKKINLLTVAKTSTSFDLSDFVKKSIIIYVYNSYLQILQYHGFYFIMDYMYLYKT